MQREQPGKGAGGRRPTAEAEPAFGAHAHRWRIGEPEGTTSVGTCLLCGDAKIFKNAPGDKYLDTAAWRRRASGA